MECSIRRVLVNRIVDDLPSGVHSVSIIQYSFAVKAHSTNEALNMKDGQA